MAGDHECYGEKGVVEVGLPKDDDEIHIRDDLVGAVYVKQLSVSASLLCRLIPLTSKRLEDAHDWHLYHTGQTSTWRQTFEEHSRRVARHLWPSRFGWHIVHAS